MDDAPRPDRVWLIDGNNVFGSRPDGWWNNRTAAMAALTQRVAIWSRTHDDRVVLVFDRPVPESVIEAGGGNLEVRAATRHGRNAADDEIVALADAATVDGTGDGSVIVVTSDRGLRGHLAETVAIWGVGRFRDLIDY